MAKAPERKSPAKASGGNTRKEVKTSYGKGHSSSIPKAVRYKSHGSTRKGSGRFPTGSPSFS